MQNFWLGQRENEGKIHWINWSQMGKAKTIRGLKLRDLKNFNISILVKQEWRLVQNPDSLAAKVLKSKYFLETEFFKAKLGSNSSLV